MWINHATSQRALRSNSALRRFLSTPCIKLGYLALLLVVVSGTSHLAAQQAEPAERSAVLLEGPTAIRGVPQLGPNAFRAQSAVYELSSGTEVEIFLLQLLVEDAAGFSPFSCPAVEEGGAVLAARESGDASIYLYRSEAERRTLLLRGPDEPGEACSFLAAFLEELEFFVSALSGTPLLPFPGVFRY